MKQRIVVIFILISVFILGILIAKSGILARDNNISTASVTSERQPPREENSPEDNSQENDSPEDNPSEDKAIPKLQHKPIPEAQPEPEPEPVPLEMYHDILEVNPYVSGWLEINGTGIDDPVVYTPKSQNYFLHRAIDGRDASSGTLFIAVNWRDGYNNTLIYGHNMKDGSGFGSLSKFSNESFGRKHNIIHFDTLYEEREYELLACFYSQIDEDELETEDDRAQADADIVAEAVKRKESEEAAAVAEASSGSEEGTEPGSTQAGTSGGSEAGGQAEIPETPVPVEPKELTLADLDLYEDLGDNDIYRLEKDEDNGRFRYYYYTDLADKDDFDYYVQNVKERALYDTGVDAEWGDELVTLSTCSYQVKNGRFVVVGVRHKD